MTTWIRQCVCLVSLLVMSLAGGPNDAKAAAQRTVENYQAPDIFLIDQKTIFFRFEFNIDHFCSPLFKINCVKLAVTALPKSLASSGVSVFIRRFSIKI